MRSLTSRRTVLVALAAASGLAMAGCSSSASTTATSAASQASSAVSKAVSSDVKLIAPGTLTVCTHLAY